MAGTPTSWDSLAQQAVVAALGAAKRAGVEVEELTSDNDLRVAAELFAEVWATGTEFAPISPELLRAFTHAGFYVAGSRAGGRIVGAAVGFLDSAHPGDRRMLHSHIAGVRAEMRHRSVGFALKQHQRGWALVHGVSVVRWTFDPLVRRNAFFNLTKLGAQGTSYHTNFYGAMLDGMNVGDESDRLEVTWVLGSERAVLSSLGRGEEPNLDAQCSRGATVLLEPGDGDEPVQRRAAGDVRLCWVPEDILILRRTDERAARDWRRALRDTLGTAIEEGFVASGMTRSGWYVLTREP